MEDGWSAEKMEVDEGGQQDGSATPRIEKIKEETKVEASPTPSSGAVTSSMNGPITETNFKEVVLRTCASLLDTGTNFTKT